MQRSRCVYVRMGVLILAYFLCLSGETFAQNLRHGHSETDTYNENKDHPCASGSCKNIPNIMDAGRPDSNRDTNTIFHRGNVRDLQWCVPLANGGWDCNNEVVQIDNDDFLDKEVVSNPILIPVTPPTKNPLNPITFVPTKSPTVSPSKLPTKDPTESPTKYPTKSPTKYPTESPTKYPTENPTKLPTSDPTKSPTKNPTKYPTKSPTKFPTISPSKGPTKTPTKMPTEHPTNLPTKYPTKYPTDSPTKSPTEHPTRFPTDSPTKFPTKDPTTYPTKYPTNFPTKVQTISPVKPPSGGPTKSPTKHPTKYPTESPTKFPTKYPTKSPSGGPTKTPTKHPTSSPTKFPTKSPTKSPSGGPTKTPTKFPTKYPTKSPSGGPTKTPTKFPTRYPTTSPTKFPTRFPTKSPTERPTKSPTKIPTKFPTKYPTDSPTKFPTKLPTTIPTRAPNTSPTKLPARSPTVSPTTTAPPTEEPKPIALCEFTVSLLSNVFVLADYCRDTLTPDMSPVERSLFSGDALCSTNWGYMFGMTTDGYLALCEISPVTGQWMERIWQAGPFIGPNPHMRLQRSGNIIVQNRKDKSKEGYLVMWDAGVEGAGQSTLTLENDGVVQIINADGGVEWDDAQRARTAAPTSSQMPTESPSTSPPTTTTAPSNTPSASSRPTITTRPVSSSTYLPGELWFDETLGIYLSAGLKARVLANAEEKVMYADGSKSNTRFHINPDAGGCFDATDGSGGWHYMSNSEARGDDNEADGGVGRLKFDEFGNLIDYRMVLTDTRMNCGSGFTPWDTYISCEEFSSKNHRPGQCWEVHPEEKWPARATKMGGESGGRFESAAFDARDMLSLTGYVTTDHKVGAVHRYTPSDTVLQAALREGDYSDVLHSEGGTLEFLVLHPDTKTFRWTYDKEEGEDSAELYFPNTEGIDVHDGVLYIVSKKFRELFVLDLDNFTYTSSSTISGPFGGQPDQIVRLIPENNSFDGNNGKLQNEDGLLYFLEDGGGGPAGVFARSSKDDRSFTIVEGGPDKSNETTGLAFCDKGRRMIFAFQDEGILFEVMREDGKPFYGTVVDVHYHDMEHWPESDFVKPVIEAK